MRKQVALVTGAAGGIGFEMAREFAREGASVIVSDLRPEACEQAASKLEEEGFDAAAIPYDVTKEAQVGECHPKTIRPLGYFGEQCRYSARRSD